MYWGDLARVCVLGSAALLPTAAVNFMRAMVKGQKRPLHIAVTMFRDKMDELLVQGMGKIPGPQRAKIEDVKAVRRGVDRRGSGANVKSDQPGGVYVASSSVALHSMSAPGRLPPP